MLRTVGRFTPCLGISLFGQSRNVFDTDKLNMPESSAPETGWDRVKKMYGPSEYSDISVELTTVMQSSMCGAFIGAVLGGFVSSRVAYINFIENNQATIFKSTAQAKKRLQDYVTVAFAKGAYRWGWRLCFFTGIFSLTATTISVYRGDTSLIEYISAGALTGALYKIDMGLAATLVGAGLGTVLSAIAGAAILGLLKITGLKMDEIRQALYRFKEARVDQYNQALEKSATIKNDEMTQGHNRIIQEYGEKKIEEIDSSTENVSLSKTN